MNTYLASLNPEKTILVACTFVIALVISWVAVPIIINICKLRNILEPPKKRGSHSDATPIFGGIAIFAGTLISFMLFANGDETSLIHKIFAGVLGLFFLGIKDDLYALAPSKKLIAQLITAGFVVIGGDLRIESLYGILDIYTLPYLVSVFFSIFTFIALINAVNLIDGIDGLAGSIGLIASVTFGLYFLKHEHFAFSFLAFALSGSLVGFLRFNFSKSNKIFMGDTGSLIVGYLLSCFAIKFLVSNLPIGTEGAFVKAPIMAVVILIVPIFDTLRVFGLRILKGRSPLKADRNHFHHLLIDNGMRHLQATIILSFSTIALITILYFTASMLSLNGFVVILISFFVGYLFLGWYLDKLRIERAKKNRLASSDSVNLNGQITPTLSLQEVSN